MLPLLLILLTLIPSTRAQTTPPECLRLSGSSACPGFSSSYISPSNLSTAFPFFSTVTDVPSFDAGVFRYLSDPDQFRRTKFVNQLGCAASDVAGNGTTEGQEGVGIRWERTVLCSQWVNLQYSLGCLERYNQSAYTQQAQNGPRMVCQSTCIEYANNEREITEDSTYCPGPDTTNAARSGNLTKDFVQCTNWTTLATNDSSLCVAGTQNEGNCGFGSFTGQLCGFCNATEPEGCCYDSDLSACAFTLAARNSGGSGGGLSKGAIAGIVVGSVIGGLLLLGLLLFGLMACGFLPLFAFGRRRREARTNPSNRFSNASSFGPQAVPHEGRGPSSSSGLVAGGAMTPAMSDLGRSGTGMFGTSSHTVIPSGSPSMISHEKMKGNNVSLAPPLPLPVGMNPHEMGQGQQKGRALLTSVRDENQSGEHLILPNSTVTVLWPYEAALPDELSLKPGMRLVVLRIYDDAWGTGQIMSGDSSAVGKQGAFPLVCVTENNASSERSYSARSESGRAESESPSGSGDGVLRQ